MDTIEPVNDVRLIGRLSRIPESRELPSGDLLLTFTVVVTRPTAVRGHVDSIECVCTRARGRRVVETAAPGDVLEVTGALRRRFWRGPAGVQSRYAVDATLVRRIRVRADRPVAS